ncbi:DUF3780 domain-containing protein [Polynucleobacter sp. 71A-WALBACH]|uniref:anti-phage-associated DUF3780 domain-containing protein n=1 Tax=Polynucleobacter sp. 71A-WALBACH TaxID=2689097 RepID=UPI001C0D6E3C|nr:anti-phage-associated DUF3780 domain-containing protein [Polynucleobacter sp. 71A-WALBACH]MBU3594600.1 DUF3780 domain-containing protein [Polynucleobacter sp. 71A-WALBACH]
MSDELLRKSNKQSAIKFVGFGAPEAFGAHIFKVNIPVGRSGDVLVMEDYGYLAGINGNPDFDLRVRLPRSKWTLAADTSRKDFNARLRAKQVSPSTWKPDENFLDRMLGKELCILLWAIEHTNSSDEIEVICRKWSSLRPEERWWLYAMTVAEGGQAEDAMRGWRKALHLALSDGEPTLKRPRKTSIFEESRTPGLFD